MASPVRLYVYDVTQGMARQLAPMLLGRQLDGVWHTGIVAYGHEYFFGGDGINYCPPSGTILGHPAQIVDLGETEIPQDMFHEYLLELSNGRFHGTAYHLLNHNCNTFSNEVAQFLTGRTIPAHITNLPAEILATPFGQMIRPFIDAMMMEVAVNSAVHIGPVTTPPTVSNRESATTPSANTAQPAANVASSTPANPQQSPNSSAMPKPSTTSQEKDAPAKKDDIDLD